MREVDKTKKTNIKCEHCKHYVKVSPRLLMCSVMNKEINYWNRCKQFEWKE